MKDKAAEVDKYRHEAHSLLDILAYSYNTKNYDIDTTITIQSYIEDKIETCREKMESLTGTKFAFEVGLEADLADIDIKRKNTEDEYDDK